MIRCLVALGGNCGVAAWRPVYVRAVLLLGARPKSQGPAL
jgi:hypothetical protein